MITGSCHCGAVTWTFAGDPEEATACNCTVCCRYGALWAYDWLGERIKITGETAIYTRGDREIAFHHCPTCGCITWWQGVAANADHRTRMAVNLRMADRPDDISHLAIRHFDGLSTFDERPDDHRRVADLWF